VQHKGKIFSCFYIKKDGTPREMVCRLGVKKYLKGGELPYDPKAQGQFGMITVCEVKPGASEDEQANSYRQVNIDTLMKLHIAGEKYQVIDVLSGGLDEEVSALNQEIELSAESMAS
jgi:hypothetical protein